MVFARYQLRSTEYIDFVVYEYGCWNLKNRAFQQVARRRHEVIERGPWTQDEITQFSRWVDGALVSQISHMKQGPGWDEIIIRLGSK
jgi:hypothetical protein